MAKAPKMISLSNISKDFGGKNVLHEVSLKLREKERLCIVGENGAGKSTLLKILVGEVELPIVEPLVATVIDTPAHPASGLVRLVEADGKTYVRYENYKTINGPDIFVYLAKDINAKEFIDLGRVKATEGNINYEVPDGVSVSEYPYVLTWCKQFGVLFNYADFSSAL